MISQQINRLPPRPGIYRFSDENDRLLYIGKAKNLKSRVKSYFSKTTELTPVKQQLVALIKKIDYTVVANETEALLLERALIKKFQPPYNVDLKDDKSWLYVAITDEDYPKVILTRLFKIRNSKLIQNSKFKILNYYGPYTSALAIRQTLRLLKKIFPYYTADGPMINLAKNTRSALHLGRYLNEPLIDKKDWLKNLRLIIKFLLGKNDELKKSLAKDMRAQAKRKNFEQAARIRDQLKYLAIISQKQQVLKNNEVDQSYLLKVRKNFKALQDLKRLLKLKKLPLRIEACDISNIGGQMSVGSMVVLTDGEIDPGQYRRFKIKTVMSANDPAMMAEVLKRRFAHPEWPKPDLILIDGGLTQLNAARRFSQKCPIIALAKRQEEIYLPNEKIPLKLPKFSPALQLLQKIRDEAHRFAIGYYRKLHLKNLIREDSRMGRE